MWWRKEGGENERKEQVHAYVNRNGNVIMEIVSFFFCRFLLMTILIVDYIHLHKYTDTI